MVRITLATLESIVLKVVKENVAHLSLEISYRMDFTIQTINLLFLFLLEDLMNMYLHTTMNFKSMVMVSKERTGITKVSS